METWGRGVIWKKIKLAERAPEQISGPGRSGHNLPSTACWSWDSSSSFRHSPSMSHSSSKFSCSLSRGNSGGLSSFSFSPCGVPSEPRQHTERFRKLFLHSDQMHRPLERLNRLVHWPLNDIWKQALALHWMAFKQNKIQEKVCLVALDTFQALNSYMELMATAEKFYHSVGLLIALTAPRRPMDY